MNRSSQDDLDVLLIEAISKGDNAALQELYDRHGASILSFLINRLHNQQLAEEILQDVMMAVWKSAATFRGECRVRTWVMSIARNRAIDARTIVSMLAMCATGTVGSTDRTAARICGARSTGSGNEVFTTNDMLVGDHQSQRPALLGLWTIG